MRDQAERLREIIDKIKIKQANNNVDYLDGFRKRNARVITVTSGKGGVGKTNITINLGIAFAEMGLRVIILDADFGLANIDVLFGIIPKYTLLDVISNQKNVLEVLCDGPNRVKFISGGSGVEELVKLDKNQIQRFVNNISLLDKLADIIIIDTGAGLSERVMSFVMAADEVLLVTTPEPTSITDAYALIKMVSIRDKNKEIKVIVNRAENNSEARDILNKLSLVAERFLSLKLSPLGYVLNDEAVIKAVKSQQPFILSYPKSQAAKQIKDISKALVDEELKKNEPENTGIKNFVNKLLRFMNS